MHVKPLITWCRTHPLGSSSGSIIDHIFSSPSLYDLVYDFQVIKREAFKDHSQVSIKIKVPQPTQSRMSLWKSSNLAHLQMPVPSDKLINCSPSEDYNKAIRNADVNLAYKIFLNTMNQVIEQISQHQGQQTYKKDQFRGRIQFHDQRRHPPAIHDHASTWQTRKIFKAINQAIEVSKALPGYRRDRTWENIKNVIPALPEYYRQDASTLMQMPASFDSAKQLAAISSKH